MFSIVKLLKYYTDITYFNPFVSIVWFSSIAIHLWISVNAILMLLIDVYGHVTIIVIGIPVVIGTCYNLRKVRIQNLLIDNSENIITESDMLNQLFIIQQMIEECISRQTENVNLIGIINYHIIQCQNSDCVCKNIDHNHNTASKNSSVIYYKNVDFLKNFMKQFYSESLNIFHNSSMLHIAFSCYLFETMKNTHAALIELDYAIKKSPSIQQQFIIYKNERQIEDYISSQAIHDKESYRQLTHVIEFEEIIEECQRTIEKIGNFQIEFWAQIINQVPDLNILHDLGNNIYKLSKKMTDLWEELCCINPNYPRALALYGKYMLKLKNNDQMAFKLLEK